MKAVSKEMRKRQKYFPWVASFIKESFKTYPNCKNALQGLVENIEKEVKELKKGQKQKTKALFETVNDLFLHFWWKIHWKKNSQWKIYWNKNTSHPYHSSENIQYFGKLLNLLIYLGIILSQGASDSLWINRVLQAINILPAADEVVYDALLQLQFLKKKYRNSYLEILRHILCSEIILDISEPMVYIKSLMLFRRLKIFMKDEVAKASLISTASKIKPPSNLRSLLSSLKISIDDDKSIVDQLLKKNSKQIFKKLHHVLFESKTGENSGSKDKERNSKFREKSENGNVNLLLIPFGHMDTPNKVKNSNAQLFNDTENSKEENNKSKKVLDLPKVCKKIKNPKKKKKPATADVNGNINVLTTESCTKPKKQSKITKTGKKIEKTADFQSISEKHEKSKKKKKSKSKNDGEGKTVKNKKVNTKPNKATKSEKTEEENKILRKRKKSKERNESVNAIPDSKKSDLCNLKTCLNEANSAINDDSILVNNGLHTEESNKTSEYTNNSALSKKKLMINTEKKSEGEENDAMKKQTFSHSENDKLMPIPDGESHIADIKNSDKKSNKNYLKSKLPNLLANYEKYSSSEENELAKKDIFSCPLVESADTVLVPDTCQNEFDSIVPFNLDSWIPSNDTSISKYPSSEENELAKKDISSCPLVESTDNVLVPDTCQNEFDSIVPFNLDSWIPSKDTSISNDGSLISDKYLNVSLNDATKNDIYKNSESDSSNSGFNDSAAENTIDSEVSRDTLFSDHGSIISDKYPNVSLIDIRKNKKLNLKKTSDKSYSSLDDDSIMGFINDSEMSRDAYISNDGSEISNKNPYVLLNDVKKVKKPCLIQKSDNSNVDSPNVGNIGGSEMSTTNFIFSEESQISDKDPIDIQKADKITDHHSDSNYNPILGNVISNELNELPTPNPDNYPCHDLHSTENRNNEPQNTQGENRQEENEIKDSISPCNKHAKTKTTLPTKRKRRQTSNNVKQRQKRRCSSDVNKDFVQPEGEEHFCQDSKTSAKDVNGKAYLNDLSMLLGNHGDIETQEKETISPSTDIALNHSGMQDVPQFQEHNTLLANHGDIETQETETNPHSTDIPLNHSDIQTISQIQEHNTLCEKPITVTHELSEKQPMPHAFFPITDKQPCLNLQNENLQNDSTCSIETVIDEFIESELSKSHSGRLSNNVNENVNAENVHSVSKNGINPFQVGSNLEPSNCFGYENSVNASCQNNNQSNMLSISTNTENRSIENINAQSMLNLSVNENSKRVVLTANPNHIRENVNFVNTNLNSGNTSFVVDCNIVNDFDSGNSSRAGSSVSGETHTIKFVVNFINARPENSSNLNSQMPYCSGNGFLTASNSSQCQNSSIASGQFLNSSNCSLPAHSNNCYFSKPAFFSRTVNELDTPPNSESHLRIPRLPRVPSFSKDETNCTPSKSKDRCSTPTTLSRKKQRNGLSHSLETTNEWDASHLDLNSSFSNIPYQQSEHCEDIVNNLNEQQKGKNHCENRELISKTDKCSASTGGKTAFNDSEQLVPYRNSRPSIYSDESEDELSVVSTMSLLSGEETDHSLLKITDEEISPKSPPHIRNNIVPKIKIKMKKLFREEKSALDSLTESSDDKKSTTVKKPISEKKRRGKEVATNTKKPKSTLDHRYNLRSRSFSTPLS